MTKHKKLQIPLPNDEAVLSNKDRDKFEDEMLRRKVGELREKNHVGIWATAIASIILAIGAIATLGLQMYQQKVQAKQYRAEMNELKKNRTTANITTLILALGSNESQKRLAAASALSIYLEMKSYSEYREDIKGVVGLVVNSEINPKVKSALISISTKLRKEGESVEIAVGDNLQKNISMASKGELRQIIMAQSQNGNIGLPLSGMDLSNSDLTGADLLLANLENANLQGAKLTHVNFKGASFQEANLKNADLSGAKLTDVNFKGASFQGANLTDTDLSGAELEKAVNLTIEQISKASTLYKVTLDPLLMEQVKENHPYLLKKLVIQKPTYRTIRYNSNYGPAGVTSIDIDTEYIIYDEIGCGGKGRDILKCIVHKDGTIQAYNKDCDRSSPILGPRTYNGCSKAAYGEYFIECCTED